MKIVTSLNFSADRSKTTVLVLFVLCAVLCLLVAGLFSCPGPSCSKLTMSLVNVSLKL